LIWCPIVVALLLRPARCLTPIPALYAKKCCPEERKISDPILLMETRTRSRRRRRRARLLRRRPQIVLATSGMKKTNIVLPSFLPSFQGQHHSNWQRPRGPENGSGEQEASKVLEGRKGNVLEGRRKGNVFIFAASGAISRSTLSATLNPNEFRSNGKFSREEGRRRNSESPGEPFRICKQVPRGW
jgi:hypothetical protein